MPIAIIVVIISIFKTVKNHNREEQLKLENNYVIGKIIDHTVSGIHENFYVEYQYFVNNQKYTKTEYYRERFRDCYLNKKCIGLEYVVFYEKKNPENAFMDFDLTELDMRMKNVKMKNLKERFEKYKVE